MLGTEEHLQNMVHVAESTVGRRYAGWFIRNTEHAQRVLDALRASPLPVAAPSTSAATSAANAGVMGSKAAPSMAEVTKPAWGSAKKVEFAT